MPMLVSFPEGEGGEGGDFDFKIKTHTLQNLAP